jgi:hypothetical protein
MLALATIIFIISILMIAVLIGFLNAGIETDKRNKLIVLVVLFVIWAAGSVVYIVLRR